MALIGEAKLLIFDEPTANLDPVSRNRVWDAMLNLKKNYSILIATQNIEEAEILGDKICILQDGALLALDTQENIKRCYSLTYRMDISPHPNSLTSREDMTHLTSSILQQLPEARQVPTHSYQFLSFYLPDSEISNILAFLESFKYAHPDFCIEVLSNNLESAYIEIFSKSLAKDNPQRLIYEDPTFNI
jgi:ABC-type multidrug transport system ATPase subunit